jgi:predicted DNA-binding transcriptional regulator AlpA
MPKRRKRRRSPTVQATTYSIKEFCQAHGISIPHYYNLKKKNLAPREMKVGRRMLISYEAATAWRIAREEC